MEFCVDYTYDTPVEVMKNVFSSYGKVRDVVKKTDEDGVFYTIHMESWTPKGEAFFKKLQTGPYNHYYDFPDYFRCLHV
jgi:hypothetical protein